jgi:REP element-mobilizing transposase RayT
MNSYHFVARTRFHHPIFKKTSLSRFMWNELRTQFPKAHAAVIMPNHIHLLAPSEDPQKSLKQINDLLKRASIKFKLGINTWEAPPSPILIPDSKHLLRQIRYVHLNPCRARLTQDLLEWEFSTHREALGLRLKLWPGIQSTLLSLGYQSRKDLERFHEYVSSDPSTKVSGTNLPRTTGSHVVSEWSMKNIVEAVRAAHQVDQKISDWPPTTKKDLVWMLMDQGYDQTKVIKEVLNYGRTQIWKFKNSDPPSDRSMRILRVYVADERLRSAHGE